MGGDGLKPPADVRLRGFAERVAVAAALQWIDARARRLAAEEVDIGAAAGRVLAAPLAAPADVPPAECAARDGFAGRAGDTLGGSDYDPAVLTLADAGDPLAPGSAAPLVAGAALPPGADAVLPFEQGQAKGRRVEIFAPVAAGAGIVRRAQQARAGAVLLDQGHVLQPKDIGLLIALGIERVRVVRRPRVALVVAAPKAAVGPARDANEPMLQRLIARDGGMVAALATGVAGQAAMAAGMAAPEADLILVAGRSGTGGDDVAPAALAERGRLAIHGIALRPGGSTGIGEIRGVPVILLPGEPLACLCAYEMFAGRLLRLCGGRDPDLPHRRCEGELQGKIVSTIGFVEVWQVQLSGRIAKPLAAPEEGGLAAALRANGFVIVPAALEGWAPGARVRVYLYGKEAEA